ncbi:long-chain acyl-CoA synthetase [Marinobacter daqiaonensis]|uniref:Long-chain acyl-CoA synthetase n=1 Tax=Marinobacter daqiaonensis TaxID=650891 RepID=A0A1I6IND1_9GAMM|nr:AMP-binding protein [Marinobacter daqiaonensis]SFR68267.1 long-chain acyl-CoA synthetase [Marinobacter daqiaonensis]
MARQAQGGTTPAMNMIDRVCAGDILTRAADLFPDNVAMVDDGRTLTYREFEEQANRMAHSLLGLGLKAGEPVGLLARNCLELMVCYMACAKANLVFAPVNLGLKPHEIAYCLNDCGTRILIVEEALAEAGRALPDQCPDLEFLYSTGTSATSSGDRTWRPFRELIDNGSEHPIEVVVGDRDPVQLLYTSGTTANPKGVVTSHQAVTIAAMSNIIANQLPPEAAMLCQLPLFHCTAVNCLALPTYMMGGKLVLAKGFDARECARLIEEHEVYMLVFLPMMFTEILTDAEASQRDFSSVHRALYAMAPMAESKLQVIHDAFPNADVVLGSGQTEFTPATCLIRPEHQWSKAGSWGTATPMTRVAIMDDHGRLLPPGETGEIVYRGPQVMTEYLNQPEKTGEAFKYGWFHSGDIASIDEDGAIWFTDRKKDIIKTGGENVASLEVERCLIGHPKVAEAAVIGVPHERWGEAITASVILMPDEDAAEEELIEYCREHLAGFKVPKAIVVVEEFPRTGTGKIQKHMIRKGMEGHFSG